MSRVTGVAPGLLLLPAREYEWEVRDKVEFRLPLSGRIGAALNKNSTDSIGGPDEFSIFEDNVLLFWELVRVMFAQAKYPKLESDECLNIVALEFVDDEVLVYGEVLKSLEGSDG